MKRILINIAIIISFLSLFYLAFSQFYKLKENKLNQNLIIKKYEKNQSNSEEMINFLRRKDSLQLLSNNSKFQNNLILRNLYGEDSISVESFQKKYEGHIILRLTDNYCFSCYEYFFSILNKKISEVKYPKIATLISFDNIRELKLLLNKYDIKIDSYIINEKIMFQADYFEAPYLYQISKDGYSNNFYSIDKSNLKNSKTYLDKFL